MRLLEPNHNQSVRILLACNRVFRVCLAAAKPWRIGIALVMVAGAMVAAVTARAGSSTARDVASAEQSRSVSSQRSRGSASNRPAAVSTAADNAAGRLTQPAPPVVSSIMNQQASLTLLPSQKFGSAATPLRNRRSESISRRGGGGSSSSSSSSSRTDEPSALRKLPAPIVRLPFASAETGLRASEATAPHPVVTHVSVDAADAAALPALLFPSGPLQIEPLPPPPEPSSLGLITGDCRLPGIQPAEGEPIVRLVQASGLEILGQASPAGLNPSLSHDSIGEAMTNIAPPPGEFPVNLAAASFAAHGEIFQGMGSHRSEYEKVVHWEAPAVCHRALFFEEPNLERHGQQVPVIQPLISAAHFFGTVPAIPYLAVSQKSRECVYSLGHYRPGSCAPFNWVLPRLSADAGAVEAATIAGLILALP